jgi:hypothetical protein
MLQRPSDKKKRPAKIELDRAPKLTSTSIPTSPTSFQILLDLRGITC